MGSMKRSRIILAAAALAAAIPFGASAGDAWAPAAEDLARVRSLIADLADTEYARRAKAAAELLRLQVRWAPFLKKECELAKDPEVVASLGQIAESVGSVRWRRDLRGAIDQAAEAKKPLFVFEGERKADFVDPAELFADPDMVDLLHDCFIPVRLERPVGWGRGGKARGGTHLALFASSDGVVRRAFYLKFEGWTSETLRKEVEAALAAHLPQDEAAMRRQRLRREEEIRDLGVQASRSWSAARKLDFLRHLEELEEQAEWYVGKSLPECLVLR